MVMMKKVLACLLIGGVLVVSPMALPTQFATSVVEAGSTKTYDGAWLVEIDDSSVAMVGTNHAHVGIRCKNLIPGRKNYDPYTVVDVRWGKGVDCRYLSGGTVNNNIALAIANYMSENY
jgi:hypothetical protein